MLSHRVCIAPMLRFTDRHYRFLMRLITRHTCLYTEMITAHALLHGDAKRFLSFHPVEHPLALQLASDDPEKLAQCAQWVQAAGFDEINLNVGCPSVRAQAGQFGACLMGQPEKVAACVQAMCEKMSIPITIKTRLGMMDFSTTNMVKFLQMTAAAGCRTFILHARTANVKKTPKENRQKTNLDYEMVYQLKHDFPHLEIVINGGIMTPDEMALHLQRVDGVMIGRAAYRDPYLFASIDRQFFHDHHPILTRQEIYRQYLYYVEQQWQQGESLHRMTKPLLGLFRGYPGAREIRRVLAEAGRQKPADGEKIIRLLSSII